MKVVSNLRTEGLLNLETKETLINLRFYIKGKKIRVAI